MVTLTSEAELLDCFRKIDRREVELAEDLTLPLEIEEAFAWTVGPRAFLLFRDRPDAPLRGIVFHRSPGVMQHIVAMCEWCHSVRGHGAIKLMTARADKRRTVGVYICSGLGCVARARELPSPTGASRALGRMQRLRQPLPLLRSRQPIPPETARVPAAAACRRRLHASASADAAADARLTAAAAGLRRHASAAVEHAAAAVARRSAAVAERRARRRRAGVGLAALERRAAAAAGLAGRRARAAVEEVAAAVARRSAAVAEHRAGRRLARGRRRWRRLVDARRQVEQHVLEHLLLVRHHARIGAARRSSRRRRCC